MPLERFAMESPTVGPAAVRELPRNWTAMRRDWHVLTLYQRFEASVALLLTIVIGAVIVAALVRLCVEVLDTLVLRARNPLDHEVFQAVFGEIMTVLIALEFNHTLQYVVARERGIIHTRIVILIALLAIARRVIVMDLQAVEPVGTAALAALALALGVTYRLVDPRRRPAVA
jgi:uncharacterized membrane protein (DUF373 family)